MEEEKEKVDGGAGGKVRMLIEKATDSTAVEVDPRFLKAIKLVVRSSDSELRLAAETLFDLMKRHHSQVRYLTLLIIDELFMRSKLFRVLTVEKLDQLLSLSVGFRRNLPLPAPPSVAAILRSKAIEFLEKWNASYGIHYRQLRLGFDHLKNTLRLQFPDIQANAARIQQERREREMRSMEILQNKFATLKSKFLLIKEEIQSTVDEITECLDIVGTKEDSMPLVPLDDEDFEEFRSAELWQIRVDALKEGEKVHENIDNKVVFDTLRELHKLLVTKHLVSVQEWISVLVRAEVTDIRFRDTALKEFIDIKNHLTSVKKKCEESGCSLSSNAKGNKEEDFWEEDKIEILETVASSTLNKQNNDPSTASTSERRVNETPLCSKKKHTERGKRKTTSSESSSLKGKLLAEAPVVTWGSYLDNWGVNRDALANQRGLEVEGHWGRVDSDAVIPAEKIAELNVHASVYKEEKNEIKPCHAPLRKGGLCQRRDLRVCPFHGPIVPRNDEGKPIYQNSAADEMPPELDAGLAQQLAKEALQNVRDRDKEEVKKRQFDKRSLKRAKLAKVREHNEAVLREAALASTSRSEAGQYAEGPNVEKQSSRNKKQTLASMLRKKGTTKGRLAQKLLNTRAKEATVRQLTLGEDANYREAFPNQW